MSRTSLDVVNGASWLGAVDQAFGGLELTSEDEVAGLAKSISQNMRDAAPVMDPDERARRQAQPGRRVRSTPGKATIRYTRARDRGGFYSDVGPNRRAFYLAFIEYGTKHITARPFLRPAIEKAVAAWGTAGSRS